MPDARIPIHEIERHTLKGTTFPDVETFPHVDTDLLYQGDSDPFHIVLPIAEVGRVSKNGLEYDEALVSALHEQLQSSAGGIRGHVSQETASSAFPVDAVHWIGALRQDKVLWAKGYIPPGETRDDTRRKKARGGGLATSIYGDAIREYTDGKNKKTWRARQFVLDTLDLAPDRRAALENRAGFVITKEMNEEGDMPEKNEVVSVADVPVAIREQIIRESDLAVKAGRVAELEQVNDDLTAQVAELATYKSIVAEIRTTLGANADIPVLVAEYYGAVSKLTQMLGVQDVASISVRVEEMQSVVSEFKKKTFENAVDSKIAELTDWTPRTDEGKKKVAAFRYGTLSSRRLPKPS
jgi:hypothetical protein